MFDKRLIADTLRLIEESLLLIIKRTQNITTVDDFYLSDSGMMLLDSICMKLIAVGESVKNIDRISNRQLLVNYPQVAWKEVMGLRDIIVHHYFDIDAEEIFKTIKNDIPVLLHTIRQMLGDLEQT